MQINLDGVLADGSLPDNGAPLLPSVQPVSIPQGGDVLLALTCYKSDGTRLDLTAATAVLTVKDRASDQVAAITKAGVITDATHGLLTFQLVGSETRDMFAASYLYDVWLTHNDQRDRLIPTSNFVVETSITPAP